MATNTTEQTLSIHREEMNRAGGLPGNLLDDDQVRDLPLYKSIIANTALVSFTAVGPDYLPDEPKVVYEANLASVQRLVRAHIVGRLATDVARVGADAAATVSAAKYAAPARAADPVASRLANEYRGRFRLHPTSGAAVPPRGVTAAAPAAPAQPARVAPASAATPLPADWDDDESQTDGAGGGVDIPK